MNHVQELMRDRPYKIPDDADLVLPRMLLLVLVWSRGALHVASHLRNFAQLMSRPPAPFQQRLAFSSPINMNLVTKSSPISLLFILLDDVWMVLVAMVLNTVFMEVPFTPMLHPILFMWNARQVCEQARQLWVNKIQTNVLELCRSYYQEL
jgi:hypothetical protein